MNVRGFTFFQLIATTFLFSVVLSVGFPLLYSYMQLTRLHQASQTITTALISARIESVNKGRPVILCSSRDGMRCSDDGEWEKGFMFFVDEDMNGSMNGSELAAKYFPALESGATIRSEYADSYRVVYLPSGGVRSTDKFNICITPTTDSGKTIDISLTGRPNHKPGANHCPGMPSSESDTYIAQR